MITPVWSVGICGGGILSTDLFSLPWITLFRPGLYSQFAALVRATMVLASRQSLSH